MSENNGQPKLAITMGDVAGIGPELVARVCTDPAIQTLCQPVVVGDATLLRKALELIGSDFSVVECDAIEASEPVQNRICCWNSSTAELDQFKPAATQAAAGRAAYDWLVVATHAALKGTVEGIVTAPLNKAALQAAGLTYPGHTEILAHECKAPQHAMMLSLTAETLPGSADGLCVAHVTLHTSIRSVPDLITPAAVAEKILLVAEFLNSVGSRHRRIAVCALNPHAGEAGLFGREEQTAIAPGIAAAQIKLKAAAIKADVTGPLPADAVFRRAAAGDFDGIVAMYHDQGHIAFKLLNFDQAVNITLGLPIIRTSPSQGTAYDIAWQGVARPEGMMQAVRVASLLAQQSRNRTLRAQ